MIMKKYLAEMVGTMVLVLMGCGVAVSLGCDPVNNIPAVVGTAFALLPSDWQWWRWLIPSVVSAVVISIPPSPWVVS